MEEKIQKLVAEIVKRSAKWEKLYKIMIRTSTQLQKVDVERARLERRLRNARRELREQKKWQPLGPINGKAD